MNTVLSGVVVGFCLFLAGFLILCRTAFLRLSPDDLALLQERHDKDVTLARRMIRHQDSVLGALSMGYACLILMAAILMATVFIRDFSWAGLVAYVAGSAFLTGLLTFVLPRGYMMRQPLSFAIGMVRPLRIFYYLFLPLSAGMAELSALWTGAFKNHFSHVPHLYHLNEMQVARARSEEPGQQRQKAVQQNLEKFADLTVQELMMPVSALEMIDGDLPMEEMVDALLACHDPRVIIYQDTPRQIVGIVHMHLMMKAIALAEGDKNAIDMSAAISEPVYISPFTPVLDQIHAFRSHGEHFALVQDRQGELKGAVALDHLIDSMAASLRQ